MRQNFTAMRIASIVASGLAAATLAAPALAARGDDNAEQAPASRQDRLTSAQSYLPMPTMSASVLNRYQTSGTLVVDMGIDIQSAELRQHAGLNEPRLHDALRTALSNYANIYYHDHTEPDPTTLTRLFQQAVDRVLGRPGAQVLLVNIIYQSHMANN
jgi:hypothetical protein